MPWFLFALLAAVFESIYYIAIKKVSAGKYVSQIAPIIFLSSAGVLFVAALFTGLPALQPNFWYYVVAATMINVVVIALYFRAFQLEDISLTLPLISFTPLFLLLTSFLLLHEFPQPAGLIGIVFIVMGSYVLYSNGAQHWPGPFRQLFHSTGARLMLLVAILFSIAANLSKQVILHSNPFFGAFTVHLAIGVVFLFWLLIRLASTKKKAGLGTTTLSPHFSPPLFTLLPLGFVLGIAALFESLALFQQIVPYVISVKRLSIFFGVLLGGMLFREKNLGRRTLGAMIMVVGVVIIALSS